MFTSVSPSHCLNMSSRILPISCLVFVFVRYYDLVYSTHFVWQGRIDAPGSSPPPPGGPDLETNINRGRSSLFWSHLAGVQVHGTAWSPCYPDQISLSQCGSLSFSSPLSQCYPHQNSLSQRGPLSLLPFSFPPLTPALSTLLRQSHPLVAQRPATAVQIFAAALLEMSLSSALMTPTQSGSTIVSPPPPQRLLEAEHVWQWLRIRTTIVRRRGSWTLTNR